MPHAVWTTYPMDSETEDPTNAIVNGVWTAPCDGYVTASATHAITYTGVERTYTQESRLIIGGVGTFRGTSTQKQDGNQNIGTMRTSVTHNAWIQAGATITQQVYYETELGLDRNTQRDSHFSVMFTAGSKGV